MVNHFFWAIWSHSTCDILLKCMIFYCSEQIRCNLLAEPSVTLRWVLPLMLASITICLERMSRTWSCWHAIYTICEWHDVTKLACSSYNQVVWSQTAKAQSRQLCSIQCIGSFLVLSSIAHSADKFKKKINMYEVWILFWLLNG